VSAEVEPEVATVAVIVVVTIVMAVVTVVVIVMSAEERRLLHTLLERRRRSFGRQSGCRSFDVGQFDTLRSTIRNDPGILRRLNNRS
jgi:hypothetical protein